VLLQSHGKRKNQRTQNVRENYCRFGFGTEMEAKKYIPPLLPKRKKKFGNQEQMLFGTPSLTILT
jgi:hypothetical protein